MNQQQLINRVVSAAIWQLMRRAPTWLLILIVGGAFLMSFAHGAQVWGKMPDGRYMWHDDAAPEGQICDFEHQCYSSGGAPSAPEPHKRPLEPSTPPLEQTPLAIAPTPPVSVLSPSELPYIQSLPPIPEDDPQSCFWLRRGIFATPQAAANARRKCE